MAKPEKLSGRIIGAAALAMMFWGLPLVTYSLFAMLNPDNDAARRLALTWHSKNSSLLLALTTGIALLALGNDYRQRRRTEWTVSRTIFLGTLMGAVQWIAPLARGDREEFWVVRTALASVTLFGMIVLTRLIAREVDRLEGGASNENNADC